jgi:hypothetical protein
MTTKRTGRVVTLHRICWSCPDQGNRQEWFTTAAKAMRYARREKIADQAHFSMVEIPTGRLALTEWLNENFNTDNG